MGSTKWDPRDNARLILKTETHAKVLEDAGASITWDGDNFTATVKGVWIAEGILVDKRNATIEYVLTEGALRCLKIRPRLNKFYEPGTRAGTLLLRDGKSPTTALGSECFAAERALCADVSAHGKRALDDAERRATEFLGSVAQRPKKRTSLTSLGGGYVVMPLAQAQKWKRTDPLLDALLRLGDTPGIVDSPAGAFLSLGGLDSPLHIASTGDDVVLALVVSLDDPESLGRRLKDLKATKLRVVPGVLEVQGPWVCFESSLVGAEAVKNDEEHLALPLKKGTYAVSHRVDAADDAELHLVRLARK